MSGKSLLILVLAIPFVIFACFDSDDPSDPGGNGGDISPYSGIFSCNSSLVSSDCEFPAPAPPSTIDIFIAGDVIMIEDAVGVWEENLLVGSATSEEICVPIGTPLDCVRCADYTLEIEFATLDSLWGSYIVTFSYSPECGADACQTFYSIEGVR